jgi:virulence factor Mce-like protein
MLSRQTLVNLIAVALASAALLLYAATTLLAQAILTTDYELVVELDRADGLLADKEVTYNGVGIGRIDRIQLAEERTRVTMRIDRDVRVPVDHDIVVIRSSPIGEQALDFRPFGEVTDSSRFLEPGDVAQPREVVMPPPIQGLLELADEVFEPLDKANTALVVSELADAVRGRRDDIRGLLRDSARFSESIADSGADYDRLFASSRVVNRALAENRDTLARIITESADATTILSDIRTEFEGLLVDAPLAVNQVSDLVEAGQANISCIVDDLGALAAYSAQPRQLENASEALRHNQWFFQAFNVLTARSMFGDPWQRVHVVIEDEPPPQSYLPEKRPIPATLPGGACDSPFGPGAPAAQQAGFELRVPDGRVIAPDDDRAIPFRRGIGLTPAAARAGTPTGTAASPAVTPTGPLPATGGALLPLLLGGLLLGVGTATVGYQRRRPRSDEPHLEEHPDE